MRFSERLMSTARQLRSAPSHAVERRGRPPKEHASRLSGGPPRKALRTSGRRNLRLVLRGERPRDLSCFMSCQPPTVRNISARSCCAPCRAASALIVRWHNDAARLSDSTRTATKVRSRAGAFRTISAAASPACSACAALGRRALLNCSRCCTARHQRQSYGR